MRHRTTTSVVLAALISVVSGGSVAQSTFAADRPKPAAGVGRVTFGLQPATAGRVDSRPSYRYAVTPGAGLTDQVAIRNLSTTPVTFRVYTTDGVNVDNGGFGLLPRSAKPRDVGAWLSVGKPGFSGAVTLRPKSVTILPLKLTVPANAQPGDHTGGVVVSLATRSKNAAGTNVELDQRVGARVFVRVAGPARPELTVRPIAARYEHSWNPFRAGTSTVTYRVTNTGNINLGGRQRVTVRGPFGPTQTSAPVADLELLLPDGAVDVATSARTWPLFRETARVSITPLVQVGDPVADLRTYAGATGFWAVPWAALALLLLLIVLAAVVRRVRRSRRPKEPARTNPVVGERTARRLGVPTSLAVAALALLPTAAQAADATPYTDTRAQGGLTFCDAQGRPVGTGSLEAPFGVKVVSATAARPPYDATQRAAALFAYQPRQGVEPGQWSGLGLTALSRYQDVEHPAVEILERDLTPGQFAAKFPPQWQGLLQLRVYLRAANAPQDSTTYAATDIKVSGATWQQVGATAGDVCREGEATSVARVLGLPTTAPAQPTSSSSSAARLPATPPASPTTVATTKDKTSLPASSALPTTTATTTTGTAQSADTPVAAAASTDEPADSSSGWIVPVLLLLALGGGLTWWGRMRRSG